MNKNRLEAFSDGVFSIVITLLILDIRLPPGVYYDNLGQHLWEIFPKFCSYVLSFFVIGVYWAVHHFYLDRVRKINGTLVFLNLIVLLLVSFIPFPTSLLGEYPFTTIPLVMYGVNLLLSNLVGFYSLYYVDKHPELANHRPDYDTMKTQIRVYAVVNIPYLIAIGLAFIWPTVSYCMFISVLLLLATSLMLRLNRHSKHEIHN